MGRGCLDCHYYFSNDLFSGRFVLYLFCIYLWSGLKSNANTIAKHIANVAYVDSTLVWERGGLYVHDSRYPESAYIYQESMTFRQRTFRQRTVRQQTFRQNRQSGHFANLIFLPVH